MCKIRCHQRLCVCLTIFQFFSCLPTFHHSWVTSGMCTSSSALKNEHRGIFPQRLPEAASTGLECYLEFWYFTAAYLANKEEIWEHGLLSEKKRHSCVRGGERVRGNMTRRKCVVAETSRRHEECWYNEGRNVSCQHFIISHHKKCFGMIFTTGTIIYVRR